MMSLFLLADKESLDQTVTPHATLGLWSGGFSLGSPVFAHL